ncbi:MAG TPA: hypothetical protein VGG72_20270 [Bryobacteraceae bacterium]|jgi:hypothetical protein
MKSTTNSIRFTAVRSKAAGAILSLAAIGAITAGSAWGQAAAPALTPVLGTVTKVDAAARSLTVKTDAGKEFVVTLDPKATIRRITAGETDATKFPVVQIGDVSVNDRVQTRGKGEGQALTVTTVYLMARSDVTKTQDAQRADWDKRGISGLVTAVGPDSITISVRTLTGVKPVAISLAPNAVVRRYAPDSVNFADAKVSALPEVKTGDEVRALGNKNEDGTKMVAEEIVAGTFKTLAGVILSINLAENQMQVRDVDTKKPLTVKINKDSSVKKLQPQIAQAIASRLHPSEDAGGAKGGKGGGGRGKGGEGGVRGGADVQQMLDSSPTISLADLKVGDAIVVSSTVGASADKVTAIKLLAGVEPILTKPGTQEMSLGGWSLGSGGGGGAD